MGGWGGWFPNRLNKVCHPENRRISPFVFPNLTKALGWVGWFKGLGNFSQIKPFLFCFGTFPWRDVIFCLLIASKVLDSITNDHADWCGQLYFALASWIEQLEARMTFVTNWSQSSIVNWVFPARVVFKELNADNGFFLIAILKTEATNGLPCHLMILNKTLCQRTETVVRFPNRIV